MEVDLTKEEAVRFLDQVVSSYVMHNCKNKDIAIAHAKKKALKQILVDGGTFKAVVNTKEIRK